MARIWTLDWLVRSGRPGVQAVLFGAVVTVLLIAADQLSVHFVLREWQRIADDVLGGVIAALGSFFYARRRTRFITERLNTVALMNHHVRNALQVIRDANYLRPENQNLTQIVEDAVERIDWALREILPGEPAATTTNANPQ
jgi:hypothetical protein